MGESHKDSPLVRVAGFEPTASWTRTMRATNCATPGWLYYYSGRITFCQAKDSMALPFKHRMIFESSLRVCQARYIKLPLGLDFFFSLVAINRYSTLYYRTRPYALSTHTAGFFYFAAVCRIAGLSEERTAMPSLPPVRRLISRRKCPCSKSCPAPG